MLLAKPHELFSRYDLDRVVLPQATHTWQPIPHGTILRLIDESITKAGLEITEERHAVSGDEKMYFGVLYVKPNSPPSTIPDWIVPDGCELTIGVRNSNNKKLSAAIGVGSNVMVCSNLAFYAEVVLKRKHTSGILRDLPHLITGAVTFLQQKSEVQAVDFREFRDTGLPYSLEEFLFQAYDEKILPSAALGPSYDELHDAYCSIWDFFNLCTNRWKKLSPISIPSKTMQLHRFCKSFCTSLGA